MTTHPKYYLTDVPHNLRRRVLDLCFKRLWHEGLELLNQNGIHHYNQDDLMNFYSWAPTFLPEPVAPTSTSASSCGVTPSSINDPAASIANPEPPTTDHPSVISNPLSVVSNPGKLITDHGPLLTDHELLTDLRDLINRFVILPEMAAETLALWVVHTYAFTLREVTTYIGVVSPEKRCGKTTLLELLGCLAQEAIAAANISPSALFRVIEEARPTLIIDEADTFMQARDEMAGILNAGYRKSNSYVVRVSDGKPRRKVGRGVPPSRSGEPLLAPGGGKSELTSGTDGNGSAGTPRPTVEGSTESRPTNADQPTAGDDSPSPHWGEGRGEVSSGLSRFSCWCPKVMAAIGRLPDTLADRCIVITMQRKMPGEKCERLRELDATQYRQRCADFVREHNHAIARARPDIPSTLNDRAADIWEPLLAIADLAGGQWPALARQAAEKLSASYDDDITLIGYFLADIRTVMLNRKVDRVLSRDLITFFNARHDRPWEDLRRGREINEWWLGHKMSALGIRSKMIRVGDVTAKGYMLADVDAAFRRYVPNAEAHCVQPPAAKKT